MELSGKKLDLLERANEVARILGNPKHAAARFTYLSPGERGIAVAIHEQFSAEIAALKTEIARLRHEMRTKGDAE